MTGEWVALIGGRLPIVSGDVDVLEFMPDYDIVGGYGQLYTYAQREGITIGDDKVGFINRVSDQTVFFAKERGDGAPIIRGDGAVQRSATRRTSSAVSGRGISTSRQTQKSISINRSVPTTYCKGSLSANLFNCPDSRW